MAVKATQKPVDEDFTWQVPTQPPTPKSPSTANVGAPRDHPEEDGNIPWDDNGEEDWCNYCMADPVAMGCACYLHKKGNVRCN